MRAATKRNPWSLIFAAIAVVLVGCAVGLTRPLSTHPTVVRSPAPPAGAAKAATIVPGPRLPHPKHLDLGLECADCHEVDEATGEPGYPDPSFCLDCHGEMQDEEKVPADQRVENVFFTADGAPKWQKAVRDYDAEILFAHAKHADKLACADCHGTMDGTQRLREELLSMADCMKCHEQKGASQACETCHRSTRWNVAPLDHQMEWETTHGKLVREAQAAGESTLCQYCHKKPKFCNDCHFGRLPTSHYGDWEHLHGRRVLSSGGPGEARCTFCHVDQTFCDDCHMNVKPTSHKHLWIRRHGAFTRAQGVGVQAKCEFCHHSPAFCEDCHRIMEPRDHTTMFRTRTHGVMAAVDRTRCMVCHETDFCARCHSQTAPRSHHGQWARGRTLHCVQCHFPITSNPNCRVCHRTNPTHDMAPPRAPGHPPGLNCRICHNAVGGGGAPPLRHVDNGQACQACHP